MTEEELEKKAAEYANEWKQYAIDNYRWDKNIIEECTEQRIIGYKDGYEQGQKDNCETHKDCQFLKYFEKENEQLKATITKMRIAIAEKNLEVEKMKCCENCNHKYCEGDNVGVIIKIKNCFDNKYKNWELAE